jgi:hypothetical protein
VEESESQDLGNHETAVIGSAMEAWWLTYGNQSQ